MNREDLEEAVVTQIKSTLAKTHVEAYPDDWKRFNVNRNDTVLVQWEGLEVDENLDTYYGSQTNIETFQIFVFYRNKRSTGGQSGGYEAMRKIFEALQNYSFEAGEMYRINEALLKRDEDSGLWIFRATYGIQTLSRVDQ